MWINKSCKKLKLNTPQKNQQIVTKFYKKRQKNKKKYAIIEKSTKNEDIKKSVYLHMY